MIYGYYARWIITRLTASISSYVQLILSCFLTRSSEKPLQLSHKSSSFHSPEFLSHYSQAPFMEGGGGGGAGGFGLRNLPNNPSIYLPFPPLTAVDRFLWGRGQFSQQQNQSNIKNNETLVSTNGLYDLSSSNGAIAGFPWPCFQERDFVEGDSLINWTCEINPRACLEGEVNISGRICKGQAKKAKKIPCPSLIKGQWTEEEDR